MKKTLFIFFSLLLSICFGFNLEECYKIYPKNADSLYLNAIKAINSSNRYKISELQSKNGYILFTTGNKYYLLTVTKRYQNQSEIKILPQNSEFSDGSLVAKDIFALIDLENQQNTLEQVH